MINKCKWEGCEYEWDTHAKTMFVSCPSCMRKTHNPLWVVIKVNLKRERYIKNLEVAKLNFVRQYKENEPMRNKTISIAEGTWGKEEVDKMVGLIGEGAL